MTKTTKKKVLELLQDITHSVSGVLLIGAVCAFVYLEEYYPKLMESPVEIPFRIVFVLVMIMMLPRALDGIGIMWRYMRSMGEIST